MEEWTYWIGTVLFWLESMMAAVYVWSAIKSTDQPKRDRHMIIALLFILLANTHL